MRATPARRQELPNLHDGKRTTRNCAWLLSATGGSLELFQSGYYRIREFFRACFAADVLGGVFAFAIDLDQCGVDFPCCLAFIQIIQHKYRAHDQRRRIRQAFARNIRSRAMYGFKDRAVVADICARHHAQTADKSRSQIADNVAVQIGQ